MFEVTFLGTASAVPTLKRNLPSIAVRHEGDLLLLDCGEGSQRQMMQFGISYMKLKAVFLSHLHTDHILGLFGLLETMALANRQDKLCIYGPKGTKHLFQKKGFAEVVEIEDGFSCDFGKFEVKAFANMHCKGSFGFIVEEKPKRRFYEQKAKAAGLRGAMFSKLLEKGELEIDGKKIRLKDVTYIQEGKKLVYSGDTPPCPSVIKAAKNADLLIHEATFCSDMEEEAKESNHSTAKQAAEVAKKAKAKKLVLTHLSARYSDPSKLRLEAKKFFPNCEVAEDGMKISV
ncbi:MAG: ribonuclease Z [Candidatus Anstonellaceae archaeon]